jgi:hypothetical protein
MYVAGVEGRAQGMAMAPQVISAGEWSSTDAAKDAQALLQDNRLTRQRLSLFDARGCSHVHCCLGLPEGAHKHSLAV